MQGFFSPFIIEMNSNFHGMRDEIMATSNHFNKQNRAKMIDVSEKPISKRNAIAVNRVRMKPETMKLIKEGHVGKGDVLAVAQVAAIMAAKRTADLIPMCHPIPISGVDIRFEEKSETELEIFAEVKTTYQTGVEMEALTAVSVAALTIYDMCKAVDREMVLGPTFLISKEGGKSGYEKVEGRDFDS